MRQRLPLIITIIVMLGIIIGIRVIQDSKMREQDRQMQERIQHLQDAFQE